jgi:predicted RNase H-like HicB family nuclease
MANAIFVLVKVRGVLREEEGVYVAGFPRLEIYSQGDSPDDAKEAARDALRLWLDSCIERGTLGDALRELGWHRGRPSEKPLDEADGDEEIRVVHLEDALGEPWEEAITVPAYQAAEFLQANSG